MKARGQPYFKASFDDLTPGVGAYNLSKESSKKQLPISGYRKTMPHDRLESAVRAAIVHGGVQNAASVAAGGKSKPRNDTTPGPGSYDFYNKSSGKIKQTTSKFANGKRNFGSGNVSSNEIGPGEYK